MKKFLALLVAILLCFSLVACGSSNDKDDDKDDKSESKIEKEEKEDEEEKEDKADKEDEKEEEKEDKADKEDEKEEEKVEEKDEKEEEKVEEKDDKEEEKTEASFPETKVAESNLKSVATAKSSTDKDEIGSLLADFGVKSSDVEEVVAAVSNDGTDIFVAVYCKDVKTANTVFDEFTTYYNGGLKDEAKEAGADISKYKVEKFGTVVVLGHEDLINAALGLEGSKEEAPKDETSKEQTSVEKYIEEHGDEIVAMMEASIASDSDLTCKSSIEAKGNGFTITMKIDQLENVDADTKKQLQDIYDTMDENFEEALKTMQQDLKDLEYFQIKVCDKNGDVLATITAGKM